MKTAFGVFIANVNQLHLKGLSLIMTIVFSLPLIFLLAAFLGLIARVTLWSFSGGFNLF